ncbi:MAG: endonuclease/exonuclease/phosphatase family protein [Planctomycetota bacterium]|nr:endonuclease/exonuclease/phosphatase family protein [Planctomycetota bacterium]
MSDQSLKPEHRREPIDSAKQAVHAIERFALLLVGSAMLGVWCMMFLRSMSDRSSLCEITCHPSLHLFVLTFFLLVISWLFWLIRRHSSFSGDRWRRRFFALLVPLLFYGWVTTPWRLLPLREDRVADRAIKVLSWNVQIGNDNPSYVLDLVKRESPDVLVLIEITPSIAVQVERLKAIYPNHLIKTHRASSGIAIYSKLPNSEFKTLYPGDLPMPAIELNVKRSNEGDTNLRPDLSIIGVHTFSPQLDNGMRIVRRNQQLAGIAQWASEKTSDVIVIGDLNITPWSPPFWRLLTNGRLVDSTWYRGYFPSWPAGLKMWAIQIDHALVSPNVKVLERSVLPDTGLSDHRPISITIN